MKTRKTATALLAALAAFVAPLHAADTILHNFTTSPNDGASPAASLTRVGNTLYGMTPGGGANGCGTIFRMNADGTGFGLLHSFGPSSDSYNPTGSLTVAGNTLYGTVNVYGGGTKIFRINTDGSNYVAANIVVGSNGYRVDGNLALDGNSLYGITVRGGGYDNGNVFRINTDFTGLVNLHPFTGGGDGGQSYGTPVVSGGIVYGTAQTTVFKVGVDGTGFQVLHSFAGAPNDGDLARGPLTLVGNKLYGTARLGGSVGNHGVLFSLNTDGSGFAILHNFAAYDLGGADGYNPEGGLTLVGPALYGMTSSGGASNAGVVFRVNPDGSGYGIVHSFSTSGGDGANTIKGDLTPSADGQTVYGMTAGGGSGGQGTIFAVVPHPAFFNGEVTLSSSVDYLAFPNGNIFGYYGYLSDPHYIYHQDMGYEYWFDANDGRGGIYFYDFKSSDFFYTSPTFPFPYLYDFSLQAFLYYYPDPTNPQRYNTNGVRYFYNFATGKIISK